MSQANHFAPAPPVDETTLVRRLRVGDQQAYETLVRAYGGRMLAIARRYFQCGADVDDVLQDAYTSAFRSIETFEASSSLATWLHRIIVNACLMKLRALRRREAPFLEDRLPQFAADRRHRMPVAKWDCPVARIERAETKAWVRSAIETLPHDYREVLMLRDIEELNTGETARLLNITIGNVKTRLHRARQVLRSRLEQVFLASESGDRDYVYGKVFRMNPT